MAQDEKIAPNYHGAPTTGLSPEIEALARMATRHAVEQTELKRAIWLLVSASGGEVIVTRGTAQQWSPAKTITYVALPDGSMRVTTD